MRWGGCEGGYYCTLTVYNQLVHDIIYIYYIIIHVDYSGVQ